MPHIGLPDLPGIRALMSYRPETSKPLNELVEVLLRGPSTLTRGERELIATVVSSRNECRYCCSIHGAVAAQQLEGGEDLVEKAKQNLAGAALSEKMKALLTIAGEVQLGAKNVSERDIAKARELGATDLEIHDTVLIAAAFCMFNRYVDGLATLTPDDPDFYRERGVVLADKGYVGVSQGYTVDPKKE
ncbi:MAG: peroxidase-related enzyme [Acidobacteria bacterium]|nr:peroxidase-related enzyme [Acidobacteriota bacterium]MDA1234325.1 peroxidase-related enzyme [Acidobacteriota bacterium]